VLHHRPLPMLLLALLALGACTATETPPDEVAAPATQPTWVDVEVGDDELVLDVDDERQRHTVARLDGEQHGEVLHASLRPGEHASTTVLLLTRDEGRYELRYLLADAEGASELYGLPWRLQVDEELARVADVAPTPVWAPDGSHDRLARVGRGGHAPADRGLDRPRGRSNPSDESRSYRDRRRPSGHAARALGADGSRPALHGHDGQQKRVAHRARSRASGRGLPAV
jgi:hypothetical protein